MSNNSDHLISESPNVALELLESAHLNNHHQNTPVICWSKALSQPIILFALHVIVIAFFRGHAE